MAAQTVEERVSLVEHKVAENATGVERLHAAIVDLGDRMDRRFDAVDRRFEAMEQRWDRRFEAIDRRFDLMERRFDLMERRFESLEQRQSTHFRWVIGVQLTTTVALMATFAAIVAAAFGR